jgi:hypothetical protein
MPNLSVAINPYPAFFADLRGFGQKRALAACRAPG